MMNFGSLYIHILWIVLQTALRAEKMKETNGYYPKPSLADQIGAAANRKELAATKSVVSCQEKDSTSSHDR